jgi:glyoxylase-like metal-dependent hydrolase (beta-lactamase superfamily II)
MKEVYPGIFVIEEKGILKSLKPPVNVYVITGPDGLIYDSGYGSRSSIKHFSRELAKISKVCRERNEKNNISGILLSHAHADHYSGLKPLRKKHGFRIILTERMSQIIKSRAAYAKSFRVDNKSLPGLIPSVKRFFYGIKRFVEIGIYIRYWGVTFVNDPDMVIKDKTVININNEEWEIFPSPGHSDDHISLYSRGKGILFSGDNVLRSINVWLGPPKSDLDAYEKTISDFMALKNLQIILPAHGNVITDPYERLDQILRWRQKRTDDVKKIVLDMKSGPFTVDEILHSLYPSQGKMKREFARGWVELTVEKFIKEGLIKKGEGDEFFYI